MTIDEVLNPRLYRGLRHIFGEVKVRNLGQALVAESVQVRMSEGLRDQIVQYGESYLVCCPVCHEKSYSLSVNHSYGQRGPSGRPMFHLAKCFHRNCMADPANRRRFDASLRGVGVEIERCLIRPGRALSEEEMEMKWPSGMVRVDELPESNPVRLFFDQEGIDIKRADRYYQVGYCPVSEVSIARCRLIIPFLEGDKLAGWLARDPVPGPAVYFAAPGMPRTRLVYNLNNARAWQTGVILPEPFDVWRFGPMAVSLMDGTWTDFQFRRFQSAFPRQTIILLVDPARMDRNNVEKLENLLLGRFSGRMAVVHLPKGRSAHTWTREELRRFVSEQGAQRRIAVRYEKCVDSDAGKFASKKENQT